MGRFRTLRRFTAIATLFAAEATAIDIQTVPPGLAPGSPYRLAILTDGKTNAESSAVSHYDTVVANDIAAVPALAALPTTWQAMVSTTSDANNGGGPHVKNHIVVAGDSDVPI